MTDSLDITPTCHCGEAATTTPVLDVRTIPHSIRHPAILGAFSAIVPGNSLILIAPHNPLPLIAQMREQWDIKVDYLDEGPDEWRLEVTRLSA